MMHALFALAVAWQTSGDRPRLVHDYIALDVGYTNCAVGHSALNVEDVERWGRALNAADAQMDFLRMQYARYVEQHNAYMDAEAPKYLQLSAGADTARAKEQYRLPGAESLKAIAALHESSARMRSQLLGLERDFIDSIAPACTEQQLEKLPLFQLEAARRQCRTFPNFIRWAAVELRSVWDMLESGTTTEEESRKVQNILADYETRITPLACRYADAYWKSSLEGTRLLADLKAGKIAPDELRSRYDSLHAAVGDAGRRVRLSTQASARSIVENVNASVAADFLRAAKAVVFAELYPDAAAIHAVFVKLAANEKSRVDQRRDITAMFEAYRLEYDAACAELEEFCVEWGDQSAQGVNGYQSQFLPTALEPLLRKRAAVSQRWLAALRELVGESDLLPTQAADAPVQSGR